MLFNSKLLPLLLLLLLLPLPLPSPPELRQLPV
jgi:hypothetical protein